MKFEHATGYKQADNMRTYDSRTYEGAYMAGVIAGGMTKTNTLGVVGSIPIPEVIRNINSFTMGAQSVNPNIKTKVVWVNEWFDPPKETEAAQSLINGGADVLMQNTDSSAVLQTAGKAGKYAFGWDSDMTAYAPNAHLASAIINWAPYYIKAVQDALDGTWKGGGGVWWGVKEGAIDIVSISDKVPADIKTKVESVKAGLKDGSFVIWKGPITSNEGKEVLAAGTQRRRQVPGRHQLLRQGRRGQGPGRREEVGRLRAMDFGRIARERLPELLRAMPKAELHIHIEGSLEPELIFELAQKQRRRARLPDVESLRAAYAFTDLQSFLDIYYAGASVLLHESDFEAMAMAYFRRAAADNVVHAELFFDPQTHTARGVPIGDRDPRPGRAPARGPSASSASTRALILCFLRHLSEDEALATLRRRAALSRALHRRRPRQQRARPSAGEVRARVRRGRRARACTASPTPARRGRRPTSRARSTCCRSSASTTACAASRIRRSSRGSRASACRSPSARCRTSSCCVFDRARASHNLADAAATRACARPSTPTTRPTSAAT